MTDFDKKLNELKSVETEAFESDNGELVIVEYLFFTNFNEYVFTHDGKFIKKIEY